MIYLAKVWLKEPIQLKKIGGVLGFEDIVLHKTDDVLGTMKWRGGNVLVLLHLSWGDVDKAEKIKVFVHHLEDTEKGEFFKLIMERLKGISIEISMSSQEMSRITKREIDNLYRE